MDFKDYQQESSRTATNHDNELLNYGLGIAGEAGEVADLIKKSYFQGHDMDIEELEKELGDVLWYLTQIATLFNLSLKDVAQSNIDKLMGRYPNGFEIDKSVNREDVS